MRAIHQFLAGFTNGDAISNEALVLRGVFRDWGFESDIFCESRHILPELRKQARDVSDYPPSASADDVVILHLSIGSVTNEVFERLKCRKALIYHNVTPPGYFTMINTSTAANLTRGLEQVKRLAGSAEVNMADSAFNAAEIAALGYRDVKVLPLVLNFDALSTAPDGKVLRRFSDGRVNVLFVGRCAPNKRLEDILQCFFHYQRYVEPESRFIHVGSFAGAERYYYLLMTQAKEMGLSNVHFAGAVPQADLNAFYKCATVFLSMSEHEGFCIPVIESMFNDVPVMAYSAAAVPETMDGAGILFSEKRHEMLAEMIGRVAGDSQFREALIAGQRARIERYRKRDLAAELRAHLAPLLGWLA